MFKFLGKALAGLVLTKQARAAVGGGAGGHGKGGRDKALAEARAQVAGVVTPDRAELIRQAMQVRAAKQTVLANLGDEERARLVATALKALLNEGRPKE